MTRVTPVPPLAALAGLALDLARCLPPGFAWWAGGLLGHAFALLPGREQRRCREHLAIAFPGRDAGWIERTARATFRHSGRMALWTLAVNRRPPADLRRGMVVVGAEHLRALARACRRGEGTFVFTGHLGNWELLVRVFATVIPTTVIARRLRHPLADALVQAGRAQGGAEVVYQDDDPRAVLRALRAGRAVGTLFDQDVPSLAGTFVPWFGRLANTPSGPAALALLARVPVQAIYCYRQAGRWVLHIGPRTLPARGGDRSAAITALTAQQTGYLEALVRRFPSQWVWWHKRWRIRPPGEADAVAAPPGAPGSRP